MYQCLARRNLGQQHSHAETTRKHFRGPPVPTTNASKGSISTTTSFRTKEHPVGEVGAQIAYGLISLLKVRGVAAA